MCVGFMRALALPSRLSVELESVFLRFWDHRFSQTREWADLYVFIV